MTVDSLSSTTPHGDPSVSFLGEVKWWICVRGSVVELWWREEGGGVVERVPRSAGGRVVSIKMKTGKEGNEEKM